MSMMGRWCSATFAGCLVLGAPWLTAIGNARPLEYQSERVLPNGRRVPVTFLGEVSKGQIHGDLTVGDQSYDIDGVFEKDGDVFVGVSKPGGGAIATFDGALGEGGKIDGVVTPTSDATKQVPLSIPVRLSTKDAR